MANFHGWVRTKHSSHPSLLWFYWFTTLGWIAGMSRCLEFGNRLLRLAPKPNLHRQHQQQRRFAAVAVALETKHGNICSPSRLFASNRRSSSSENLDQKMGQQKKQTFHNSTPTRSKFYAVAHGNEKGLFQTWAECEKQVRGFKGSKYKSFASRDEALSYLAMHGVETVLDIHQEAMTAPCSDEDPNSIAFPYDQIPFIGDTNSIPYPRVLILIHVMFDGGSRGNPGDGGAGALIQRVHTRALINKEEETQALRNKEEISFQYWQIVKIRQFLQGRGGVTNNQAEYQGLCNGLEYAVTEARKLVGSLSPLSNIIIKCLIQGDSEMIIKQMMGLYKCKNPGLLPMKALAEKYIVALQSLESLGKVKVDIKFNHVRRESNTIADALANQAMDNRSSWLTAADDKNKDKRCDYFGINNTHG